MLQMRGSVEKECVYPGRATRDEHSSRQKNRVYSLWGCDDSDVRLHALRRRSEKHLAPGSRGLCDLPIEHARSGRLRLFRVPVSEMWKTPIAAGDCRYEVPRMRMRFCRGEPTTFEIPVGRREPAWAHPMIATDDSMFVAARLCTYTTHPDKMKICRYRPFRSPVNPSWIPTVLPPPRRS